MTERKQRAHPDDAATAVNELLREMGYGLIALKIGWCAEGFHGDELPYVKYGYFGDSK